MLSRLLSGVGYHQPPVARVSATQWADAFRAGGYTPEISSRFINKLKLKILDGLALERQTGEE